MQVGINLASKKFKDSIIEIINNSGLPLCLIGANLREILNSIDHLTNQAVQKEQEESLFNQEEKETEKSI